MSQQNEGRGCPRCERLLTARERHGGDGLTLVWQCSCGWAAARTVSRETAFRQRRELPVSGTIRVDKAGAAPAKLFAEIDRQNALSRRSSEELKAMLGELARAESAVAASQPVRITVATVERMRRRVMVILSELEARSRP